MRLAPALLLCAFAASAATPGAPAEGWKEPDSAERRWLETLTRRLERYPKAVPKTNPVADAMKSLREEVVISVGCATITVRTELRHWQPVEEKGGWYEWGGVSSREAGRAGKDLRLAFVNALALDAKDLEGDDDRSVRHKTAHAALFYHELLHAQLLIDAMRSDAEWRKAFCADPSNFDFEPADFGAHDKIGPLEAAYQEALWAEVKALKEPF